MKGSGNNIITLLRKLYFCMIPTCGGRSRYINRHRELFHHIGDRLFFQPRIFPSDPELISLGDNVMIASNVRFINHDITNTMLNRYDPNLNLGKYFGAIEIGDNVMIGAFTIIMPNVRIGNNVIIAAGSIVTKDIPDNVVAAGIPAKPINQFETLVKKRSARKEQTENGTDKIWRNFYEQRKENC